MLATTNHATLEPRSAGTDECLSPQAQLRTTQPQLEESNDQTPVDADRFPHRVFDSTHAIAAFPSSALAEQFIAWCREP